MITYFNNLCRGDMALCYKDLPLIPSKTADSELFRYGLTIEDCIEILEQGYSPRKRAKGSVEKWLNCGKKTFNVVLIRSHSRYFEKDVWLITHVGCFTTKKRRKLR